MSDETSAAPGTGAATDAPEGAGNQPMLMVNAQYVKDLSFENPNAPQSLMEQKGQPNVQIAVDVNARQIAEKSFEVTLQLRCEGKSETATLFMAEVAYAGVFTLGEVQQDYVAPLLYIEAPRQLFPFARNIIADCIRDGGFPQLLVQPIDFVQLYQQRAAQAKAGQQQGDAAPAAAPEAGASPQGSGNGSGDGKGKDDDRKFEFEL